MQVKSLLSNILDLLLPRYCPVCGNRLLGQEDVLCADCLLHMPYTSTWQQPYDNEMAKMFWHQVPVERCCALFYYQRHAPVSNLIYKIKYGYRPDLARSMGRLLGQEGVLADFFDGIEAIVPVPLSKSRQHQRGYNQSMEIARGLQEVMRLPILTDALRRTTFTESQTHKDRWQRRENVAKAFCLDDATTLDGLSHVLVVDDICTTGATAIACCQQMAGHNPQLRFSILTLGYVKG